MKTILLVGLALVLSSPAPSFADDEVSFKIGKDIDFDAVLKPIRDAKALLAQRKYAAAERAFRALTPKHPGAEVKVGLGEAILGQKRFGEALAMFDSVSPAERANDKVPFQLKYAIVLYAVGRRQEALDLYADSVKGIPSSMEFGRSLLPLSFQRRTTTFRQFEVDARTAIAFYRFSSTSSNEALPEAERALYLDPTHALARCAEALALMKLQPELALKRFESLAKTAPDSLKQEIEGAMPGLQELAEMNRTQLDARAKEAQSSAPNKP